MKNKKYCRTVLGANLIFFLIWFSPIHTFAQKTVDKKLTPREIAQQTLPSTVLLVMGNRDTEEVKSGSGFFVAEDVVVTNFHVIKQTTEGYAKIYGQEKIYEILGIVGTDEKNDLALLKIKGIKGKALKLNADDSAAIGDEVFAVGNPKGLEGTFSQGIVSSIRKTGKFDLLQITASISSGSSGGAVLNDKGEVIGVAVGAIESGQSLNFAIPVSLLRSLISNQQSLKLLASNSVVAENKVQPNRKAAPKLPNNLPTIKSVPEKKSKIQFKVSDLAEENLFGNVKLTKETTYIPEKKFDEWILGERVAMTIQEYNSDGYEEYEEETLYSEKMLFEVLALTYIYYMNDKKLPITRKSLFYYDYSNGLKTRENYWKCADCATYELKNKFLIKYQENEETAFDVNGKILWKRIRYKGRSGKTFVENFDKDGKIYVRELTYKAKIGNVKETWYSSKTNKNQLELSSKIITEDIKGQLKETNVCIKEKDKLCGDITIKDESTKLTLRHSLGSSITKYEYEFDSSGNWTKQTEYQQVTKFGKTVFEPTKIIVREISYY
jgi:Trypsin-like peptidase domain